MNIAHDLDAAVDGSFVPYRDHANRPRLLDLRRPSASNDKPEAVAARKKLTRMLRTSVKAARDVTDNASAQRWFTEHGEPFAVACTQAMGVLGACIGDEGRDWCALDERLTGYLFARFGRLVPR